MCVCDYTFVYVGGKCQEGWHPCVVCLCICLCVQVCVRFFVFNLFVSQFYIHICLPRLCLWICLFLSLCSVPVYVVLSFCLPISLSLCLCVSLSLCVRLSLFLFLCQPVSLSLCPSVSVSVSESVSESVSAPVSINVPVSVSASVSSSVCVLRCLALHSSPLTHLTRSYSLYFRPSFMILMLKCRSTLCVFAFKYVMFVYFSAYFCVDVSTRSCHIIL